MRDIHLHMDRDRAMRALEHARQQGHDMLFAQQFSLPEAYEAAALYACMSHDPDERSEEVPSEFFWQGPRHTIVAIGHGAPVASISSFAHLQTQLAAWRARCLDAETSEHVRVVGGLGFDGTPHASHVTWRGYDHGKFWIPCCMIARDEQTKCWTLTLCETLSVEMTDDQLGTLLKRKALVAEAWLEGARRYELARDEAGVALDVSEPGREAWGALVARTARHLAQPEQALRKVVLARRVEVDFDQRLRPAVLLSQLAHRHPTCTTFLVRPGSQASQHNHTLQRFIGASPECLVRMHAGTLYVDALAGSAPRSTPDVALLDSSKDREEHRLVLDAILDTLTSLATIEVSDTHVDTLSHIKHLRTRVSGEVHAHHGLTTLAGALHPTPAVCGQPRDLALAYLREHEYGTFLERGWYTGVVGWLGLEDRSGELFVALRCALVGAQSATLFVGAGIMPDSTAESELAETRHKAEAVLGALRALSEEPS